MRTLWNWRALILRMQARTMLRRRSEPLPLIGITGPAGSGKTTLAVLLCARYGYVRRRFAEPLKVMLSALLRMQGVADDIIERMIDGDLKETPTRYLADRTPRWAMQSLGTEWGRRLMGSDLWLDAWAESIVGYDAVVVDDVRFRNEADRVRRLGGIIVRLERDGCGPGEHASEREYLEIIPDFVVTNPWTIRDVEAMLGL